MLSIRLPQTVLASLAVLAVWRLGPVAPPEPVAPASIGAATAADLATAMAAVDVQRTVLRVRLRPEAGRLEAEGTVTLTARREGVEHVPLVLAAAFEQPEFRVGSTVR